MQVRLPLPLRVSLPRLGGHRLRLGVLAHGVQGALALQGDELHKGHPQHGRQGAQLRQLQRRYPLKGFQKTGQHTLFQPARPVADQAYRHIVYPGQAQPLSLGHAGQAPPLAGILVPQAGQGLFRHI